MFDHEFGHSGACTPTSSRWSADGWQWSRLCTVRKRLPTKSCSRTATTYHLNGCRRTYIIIIFIYVRRPRSWYSGTRTGWAERENARSIKLSFLRPQRRKNEINIIRKTNWPAVVSHGGSVQMTRVEAVRVLRCHAYSAADEETFRPKTNRIVYIAHA